MITLLLMTGLLFLIYYYSSLKYKYWKNKEVIHPHFSILFGNIGETILCNKSVQEVFDDIYNKYNELPFIGFYRLWTPCLLLRDPGVIKDVLVTHFNSFSSNELYVDKNQEPLLSKNPFVSEGIVWKKNRGQMTSMFTAKRVKEVFPLLNSIAVNLVKHIESTLISLESGVDVKRLFIKYNIDAVASYALGLNANCLENPNSEYLKKFDAVISPSLFIKLQLFVIFNFPQLPKLLKIKLIPKEVEDFYKAIVNSTMEYRKNNAIYLGDYLDSLADLKEKLTPDTFTIDDIAGNILSFFTEGTENGSTVLTFVMYELALHPTIQSTLRNEIVEMRLKHQGKFSYDSIQEMDYLDQIIKESMRKNTVVPVFKRICTETYNLHRPPAEGCTVTIEPGTPVIIPVHSIHHDPKYFVNPYVFDPSRFSKDNRRNIHNYSFMPFGEGPRVCLGMRLGMAQIKMAIVHLISNFEVKINKRTCVPYKIDPHYFILAARDGIWLDFCKYTS